MANARTGGEIVVANLVAQGATHAFCVPGESFLPVLDALYDVRDRLRLVICRQEGGAAYMAEAVGKLTGRPGVAFVTRGPGASNAAVGIHTAAQDSSPMIVFVGQVGERLRRPRRVPGDRLPPDVRQRRQVGGADRSRRAHPRVRRPRVPRGDVGPTGPGGAGAARGHAARAGGMRGRPACRGASRDARRCADRRGRGRCSRRRGGRLSSRAAAAGTSTRARRLRASPKRTSFRSPARSATRTCSTTATPITRATSGSASIRSSPCAFAMPMCSS